jgi:hypothetical protein
MIRFYFIIMFSYNRRAVGLKNSIDRYPGNLWFHEIDYIISTFNSFINERM